MTITNGYCTDEELRAQFDDNGSKLPAPLVHRAINATSRAIDAFTGRRFWQDPTPVVRTFRPLTSTYATVLDISTTTGLIVKVDSGLDGTFAETWTLGTQFVLGPSNAAADGRAFFQIRAVDGYTFPLSTGRDTIQATARFGWPALPDNVNQAAIIRSAAIFKRKESISGVAGFDGFGAVRISRQRDPDVVDLLTDFTSADMMVA